LNKFERITKVAAADHTQQPHYFKARPVASLIFSARDFSSRLQRDVFYLNFNKYL